MIYILFLFVKLSILGLSVSYLQFDCLNYKPESQDVIHLIKVESTIKDENSDTIDKINKLNDVLYEKCQNFYNMKKIVVNNIDDANLKYNVDVSNVKTNFINLFAHSNIPISNYVDKNMVYAGEVYDEANIYSFVIHPKDKPSHILSANYDKIPNSTVYMNSSETSYFDNWNVTDLTLPVFKLMSKRSAEINRGDLLDFVTKLRYSNGVILHRESCLETSNEPKYLDTVLVCIDKNPQYFEKLGPYSKDLRIKATNNCEHEIRQPNRNFLAVVAPTPFKTDIEFTIPTVFYKTPHISNEDKTQFPNSVNLINSDLLIHGFMNFINDMGWGRVAVLSDDADYSQQFESGLLELFKMNGIIHNVQRCNKTTPCDFSQALHNLFEMRARIIIINGNETNAIKISKEANQYSQFTLLYRVPKSYPLRSKAFFITLSPPSLKTKPCGSDFPDDSIYTGIINGLEAIGKAHLWSQSQDITNWRRNIFFRKFTNYITRSVNSGAIASVRDDKNNILSKMDISHSGEVVTLKKYTHPVTLSDYPSRCIGKTSKFEKPCDEYIIIYFMFIVILLAILILVITCFFHHTSPIHGNNYSQF